VNLTVRTKSSLGLIAAFALCATSCTQYQLVNYSNPNASWDQDVYQCGQEAANTFPPQNVVNREIDHVATAIANPPVAPVRMSTTNCSGYGNSINCTTIGSPTPVVVQQGPVYRETVVDVNAKPRQRHLDQCLAARGWIRQAVKK
jgi:hypothetical protein